MWKSLIGTCSNLLYNVLSPFQFFLLRYCEAIGTSIRSSGRGSQFYTPTFIGELKNLSDRLTAAPQVDKTASWISKKMTKPSLDTIGNWLEGRFSKLIIGEGEETAEAIESDQAQAATSAYGPFSHYSTISSTAPSAQPSRSSTPYIPTESNNTTTSTPFVPSIMSYAPVDRAASAMDHLRPEMHRASPVQRVASASATTTTFSQSYSSISNATESTESEGQEVSWWGRNSRDQSGQTPTATTFHKVDANESGGNFISLMDDFSPGPTPMANKYARNVVEEEEEEDLGFGNASSKKKGLTSGTDSEGKSDETKTEEPKQEAPKPGTDFFFPSLSLF